MTELLTIGLYIAAAILALLLARGLWILYQSSEARLEKKKAEVMAKEGRNPENAMTYHQDIEAQAIAYLKRVPLLRRVLRGF